MARDTDSLPLPYTNVPTHSISWHYPVLLLVHPYAVRSDLNALGKRR
jgi:hypothetical protein